MINNSAIQSIASFLSETPDWVEGWLNAPVKKAPSIDFPDFTVSFFSILPIEHFDSSLKLNRDWYRECRRDLENMRASFVNRYWETIEEYKKASKNYNDCWNKGIAMSDPYFQQCKSRYYELASKKTEDFKAWVEVDHACLRCGFCDLIDHKDPNYYIVMYGWGMDPYEIPTPGNDPEGILDYQEDEDSDA